MGKETFENRVKKWVSGIGWVLFLWGLGKTAEEYWREIQLQENAFVGLHLGDPCIYCNVGHDYVGVGPCPGQ